MLLSLVFIFSPDFGVPVLLANVGRKQPRIRAAAPRRTMCRRARNARRIRAKASTFVCATSTNMASDGARSRSPSRVSESWRYPQIYI